jgi:hypothetical protein
MLVLGLFYKALYPEMLFLNDGFYASFGCWVFMHVSSNKILLIH